MGTWRNAAIALLTFALGGCEGLASDLADSEAPPEFTAAPKISAFTCAPAPGGAPLTELCQWSIAQHDGQPVSCTVAVEGAEQAEYSLPDCQAALSQKHTFAGPGSYTVKLVVRDAGGHRSTSTLEVVVEQPNRAPVIDTFAAAPASGLVPLTTRFSWTISDADAEPLTCKLDLEGDGTVEYTLPNCTSALTQGHTFTAAVVTDVFLTVTDARGLSVSKSLKLTARAPVGDVRVTRAEWGQSVIAASPRLVEGKAALLRVYVLADKANLSGVVVKAEGFRGGASLGELTLTGPSSPPTAEAVADLTKQYRATVPAEWVAPGLEVRVTADPDDALPETDETNNSLTVTPTLGKPTVLEVTAVPVVHLGVTASTPNLEATMKQVWPLKGLTTQVRAPYTFSGVLTSMGFDEWGQLLGEMASLRAADGSQRYYYGFVRVTYGAGVAGIGYIGQEAATGRDDSLDTATHELGHNMGRSHAPCGGAAGADPSYPYAGAKIGSWGYDADAKRLIDPSSAVDLMSYCNPAWVSDYNYRAVQTYLESNPPQAMVAQAPSQSDFLLVSGSVTSAGVQLRPLQRVLGAPSPAREGPYTLRLHTAQGLVSVPFDVTAVGDAEEQAHFSFLVPYPGTIQALEVVRAGQVLLKKLATFVPTGRDQVKLTDLGDQLVVSWDAQAYSHASVAHLGAAGRTTLAFFLEGGAAVVRADGLPRDGRFEVSLSDGLNPVRQIIAR